MTSSGLVFNHQTPDTTCLGLAYNHVPIIMYIGMALRLNLPKNSTLRLPEPSDVPVRPDASGFGFEAWHRRDLRGRLPRAEHLRG